MAEKALQGKAHAGNTLVCLSVAVLAAGVAVAACPLGSSTPLLDGWRFHRGEVSGAEAASFDDSSWELVRIPHDWAITGDFDRSIDIQYTAIREDGEVRKKEHVGRTGALPWLGVGWYRRTVELPQDTKDAELVFDGAMANPVVYSDGEKVGEWKFGYAPFVVKLPLKLRQTIAVRLENQPRSARWYPGAGLYRLVVLRVNCRNKLEDVFVWTEKIEGGKAFMRVRSPEGERTFVVDNPRLWTPETPHLYTLEPEGVRYGIRTICWTNGVFELNGKRRNFKGVCLHHDLGPIGAAFNVAAFRRQVRLLKEMGCDSIRTSHNIPCSWQMDVCDEEGMMVMAESFDEWRTAKCENGYHLFFDGWWRRDIEALVRFHRNHPSVVMWSIGNEIPDQDRAAGTAIIADMVAFIRTFDPTRPVTQGHSRMPGAINVGGPQVMDIPGVTYRLPFYGALRNVSRYGGVLGAETASTVSSRGCYKFPVEVTKDKRWDDGQCSSYDLGCCSWSNLPDDDWAMQDDNAWTLGEFVWTGFDYLGEPTPYKEYWPSRSAYFGIFDLAGIPKDRYWLYRSRWNEKSPTLHLLPHWTWPGCEGKTTPVYCYTSWPSAELFVNGKSQGRRTKDPSSRLDRYRLRWNDVVYEPGELKVVAYDAGGRQVGEETVRTVGKPCHIEVSADRVALAPPSCVTTPDLAFVTARIVDKDGNLCPDADARLVFAADGAVRFKAVCNGDATSLERFVEPAMKTFHGQLVVVVEAVRCGEGSLTISSSGLAAAKLSFKVAAGSLEERWANPAPEMRILPIRHYVGKDDYHPHTLLDWLDAGGFGGMVCSVKRSENYLDSEREWAAFTSFVRDAHSRGMTLWLYDEYGYPSGTARGRTLKGHPEWQARGALIAVSNVTAGVEVAVDPPPGEFLFAAAYPVKDRRIERDKAIVLPPFDGRFTWRAPMEGAREWRLFAITKDYLFKGTHVERVSGKIPYINLLMKEPCDRFIELTHERYLAHLGKDFPKCFVSTFNDESALQSNWSHKMPYRALPWAEDMPDQWRRETGRDLAADLPVIALGAADGEWRKIRWKFWDIVGRRVSENYFGRISAWCTAHGIASGGHLKAEQVLSATTGEYGDIFRCIRAMTAPGIDNLMDRPEDFSVLMPLLASSAKDLNGDRLTMCEYCDHQARVKKDLESVTKEIARGVLHKMILSGINTFPAFHSLTAFKTDAERRALNMEVGRANELMHDTRNAADVAILYPADALKMAFEPGFGGAAGAENFAIEKRFNTAGETLYRANVPFILVDDESIEGSRMEGRELVYNGLRWKAVYLPGSDEVRPETKAKLDAFVAAGGTVLYGSRTTPSEAVARLPRRPVEVESPAIRVVHRRGADGDVYYFWNERPEKVDTTVRFSCELDGAVLWDPYTGEHRAIDVNGGVPLALSFGPYSALAVTGGGRTISALPPDGALPPSKRYALIVKKGNVQ